MNPKISVSPFKNVILIIIVAIFVIAVGVSYYLYSEERKHEAQLEHKKQLKEYDSNLDQFITDADILKDHSHDDTTEFQNIWHEAIWDKTYTIDDVTSPLMGSPNIAIDALKTEYQNNGEKDYLHKLSNDIQKDISKLKNPPKEYSKVYDTSIKLYSTLKQYEELAEDPNGSLDSYTEKINNFDQQAQSQLDSIKAQISDFSY